MEGAYEGVAEVDEFLVVGPDGAAEGIEHDFVAGGVDGELDAQESGLGNGADGHECRLAGDGYFEHAITHLFDEAEVGEFVNVAVVVEEEEAKGFAGFEIGVGGVLGDFVADSQDELVEGVVLTVAD